MGDLEDMINQLTPFLPQGEGLTKVATLAKDLDTYIQTTAKAQETLIAGLVTATQKMIDDAMASYEKSGGDPVKTGP